LPPLSHGIHIRGRFRKSRSSRGRAELLHLRCTRGANPNSSLEIGDKLDLCGSAAYKGCAILFKQEPTQAGMVELADAADSKSADRKVMGVRPPLPAPKILKRLSANGHSSASGHFCLVAVLVAVGSFNGCWWHWWLFLPIAGWLFQWMLPRYGQPPSICGLVTDEHIWRTS
jgi:hypothetical protein